MEIPKSHQSLTPTPQPNLGPQMPSDENQHGSLKSFKERHTRTPARTPPRIPSSRSKVSSLNPTLVIPAHHSFPNSGQSSLQSSHQGSPSKLSSSPGGIPFELQGPSGHWVADPQSVPKLDEAKEKSGVHAKSDLRPFPGDSDSDLETPKPESEDEWDFDKDVLSPLPRAFIPSRAKPRSAGPQSLSNSPKLTPSTFASSKLAGLNDKLQMLAFQKLNQKDASPSASQSPRSSEEKKEGKINSTYSSPRTSDSQSSPRESGSGSVAQPGQSSPSASPTKPKERPSINLFNPPGCMFSLEEDT